MYEWDAAAGFGYSLPVILFVQIVSLLRLLRVVKVRLSVHWPREKMHMIEMVRRRTLREGFY